MFVVHLPHKLVPTYLSSLGLVKEYKCVHLNIPTVLFLSYNYFNNYTNIESPIIEG